MEVQLLMVYENVIKGTNSGIVGGGKGTRVKDNSEFGILEFVPAREHIPRTTFPPPPPRLVRTTRSERKSWGPGTPPLTVKGVLLLNGGGRGHGK